MAGSIFVIIVAIVSLIATLNKQKQEKAKRKAPNTTYTEGRHSNSTYTEGRSSYYKESKSQNSMKNRANAASKSTSAGAYATRKAAERAKDNMTEQELRTRPSAQAFKQMAGVEAGDGAILSAAKMHSLATELGNEYDSKEDLMEPVFNLMVTGPDTSIPNERDFVSEGMDLINSYNC
ncbi:MAG: hypothetical protein IJ471_06305 [Eubacterium sp.]|nr:hypothetical protein [Eubacterium sp.]